MAPSSTCSRNPATNTGVTARISSSANGVLSTINAVASTPSTSQMNPAPTDMGGNSLGRFVRIVRTITTATISRPTQ